MKKFIKKIKKSCHNFMTEKSGFSLVELIVVIAIMAVMAAILAPALLGYVEKSRMQKDDSAMDEVVNAMQLSLADQDVYDEVLEHSVWDNVSCYIDKKNESEFADYKVSLKAANAAAGHAEQYMFSDEARQLDETVYFAAGNMRGLTITFSPLDDTETYDFANGILNKFVDRNSSILSENPELYNNLRSVIGDKLKTTSQTYRNSDYTVFIRVGSTGGAEAIQQDAIQVWGQFNGTNLSEKTHKYELSSNRVVGAAGANDATNNATNNENGDVNFSENVLPTFEMTRWDARANNSNHDPAETITCQYEPGMTWREWVDSDYNQHDFIIIEIGGKEIVALNEKCSCYHCAGRNDNRDYKKILLSWMFIEYNESFDSSHEYYTTRYAEADAIISFERPIEKPEASSGGKITEEFWIYLGGYNTYSKYGEIFDNDLLTWF